jgi:glycosyltransferase involved in cell wall biosynthesis
LSYNSINHFTVIRRSLVEAVGRYRPGFEGSQDHDLLLRVTERTDRVVHIPRVLYHWRSLPSSTAASAGVKQYVHDAGRKAVEDACRRRSLPVTISRPAVAVELNLPILSFTGPDDGPTVSIVVTGTKEFTSKTSYRNFEIIANTDDTAAGRNRSAATATGDLLLFLDAELEPRDGDWLAKLVANLGPGVGVVGPRIHDVDGRIATAGIVVGLRDGCGTVDAFAGQRPAPASYYFYAEVTRNVSAVSGRCFLTRRAIFQQLGGFDDTQFPRTTWDVDYCLRANQNGSRNLYVGDCVMTFLPSSVEGERSTKIRTDNPTELLALRRRHGDTADPFHNPNFSRAAAFVLGDDPPWPGDRPAIPCLVFAHNLAAAEGAPRYLSDLIVGLTRKKTVIPTVLCGHGGAGEAAYRDHAIPVAIHDEPWKLRVIDGLWSRAEYRNAVAFFRNRLRAASPKLVIVNTLLGFPMIEAAARERIPTAWIIHESYSTAVRDRVFSPFAKGRCEAAFALADRIVPCSHDAAALVRHLDVRGRIRVRHNAIDPAELGPRDRGPRPPGPVRIIAVGTICERKGQHTLAEAAAILAKANLDFVVELIGARDGVPYLDYVRQLLRRRDVERFVKLIPETDAKPYFRSADIFACTSHMETYSRSILEAMAFGLPIVSTPCQGVGEQVVWGENALKFAAGDAGGLADCLRRLIADRQLRARMARASRDQFECHPPFAAMLDSFEDVFRFAMKR